VNRGVVDGDASLSHTSFHSFRPEKRSVIAASYRTVKIPALEQGAIHNWMLATLE
jgi:hypothetical protein